MVGPESAGRNENRPRQAFKERSCEVHKKKASCAKQAEMSNAHTIKLIMRPAQGPGANGMWSDYAGVTYNKHSGKWKATGVGSNFATELDAEVAYSEKTHKAKKPLR